MKIAVIGATGTIGSAVAEALENKNHEVVRISRSSPTPVDIDDPASIERMYEKLGEVDAVVSAAGNASFAPLGAATDEDFALGIRSKLMGQVNLVRTGLAHLKEGGVFVLTSGVLARAPWPGTAAVSMVNAGVESFVLAAALDLDGGRRINVVSPPLVRESAQKMGRPAGEAPGAADVAQAYVEAIEGTANGETIFVTGHEPAVRRAA